MYLQTYKLRLKTASEVFHNKQSIQNSDSLFLYFKGDEGLTQTIILPLNKFKDEIYENTFDLLDVGNLSLVHMRLDAKNLRWKFEWIDLERKTKNISHFPINQWIDTNQNSTLDILINEGSVQLASIYTILINTGTISSSSQVHMQLALIGDGASTLPLDLNTNSPSVDLFEPGSKDRFSISPFQTVDVGEVFHVQIWCESKDKLPYYCESIEISDNFNSKNYFFLVNEWFGPNLEENISVPAIDRTQESNVFTISIKTNDISDSNTDNFVSISIRFDNGKIHEEALHLSETHQIPFQKNNVDFFMLNIDDINNQQVENIKVCFVNKSKVIQWNCAWIEIRDIFYQRNYCYILSQTLTSIYDRKPYNYTSLEKLIDTPCSKVRHLKTN